jgi:hypothetical protein
MTSINQTQALAAAVHIRYHSAPSLYLLLVCANTNPGVLLSLPFWGMSSLRNPGTRVAEQPFANILTIQHVSYTQQSRLANNSDSFRPSISSSRSMIPVGFFRRPFQATGLTGHTRQSSPKASYCSEATTILQPCWMQISRSGRENSLLGKMLWRTWLIKSTSAFVTPVRDYL